MNVWYLTRDLLFSTRVTSAAKPLGIAIQVVGTVDLLAEKLAATPTAAVLVDLEHPDAEPVGIQRRVAAHSTRPTLIGYGPHVKEPLLAAAREAGFDLVLSRGQFDQQIASLLKAMLLKEPPGLNP